MIRNQKALSYKRLEIYLIGLGLVLLLCYVGFYVMHNWGRAINLSQTSKDVTDFLRQFRSPTLFNFLVLLLLTSVTSAIPFMSNAAFAIFNGITFGPFIGFLMTLLANILGNYLVIEVLKKSPLSREEKKVNEHLKTLDKFPNPRLAIILGYIFPIVPTLLVNYRVVELKLPFKTWLLLAGLGLSPLSLLYSMGGSAILKGNFMVLLVIIIVIALAFLGYKYIEKGRQKHGINRDS
ncbi:VTT domain-containing protein [Streptococcus sp. zg-JUN1979]|uniref:VTT domain-containing protein n=1 Tax=Streptococcus sp. zg-JUN1979 TaxID=3391450 RepID=UPI0039A4D4CC